MTHKTRDRQYRKHRKTGNPKDKLLFRELKHKVQQQIRTAYHHYVEDILGLTTEPGTVTTYRVNQTPRNYSHYSNTPKRRYQSIPSPQSNGKTFSDTTEKADILNNQFQSVFSPNTHFLYSRHANKLSMTILTQVRSHHLVYLPVPASSQPCLPLPPAQKL